MFQYIIGAGMALIILTVMVLLLSYTTVYEPKGRKGKRLLERYLSEKRDGKYRGTTYLLILLGIGLVSIAVVFCFCLMVD